MAAELHLAEDALCGAPKAKITLRQEARIQELGG